MSRPFNHPENAWRVRARYGFSVPDPQPVPCPSHRDSPLWEMADCRNCRLPEAEGERPVSSPAPSGGTGERRWTICLGCSVVLSDFHGPIQTRPQTLCSHLQTVTVVAEGPDVSPPSAGSGPVWLTCAYCKGKGSVISDRLGTPMACPQGCDSGKLKVLAGSGLEESAAKSKRCWHSEAFADSDGICTLCKLPNAFIAERAVAEQREAPPVAGSGLVALEREQLRLANIGLRLIADGQESAKGIAKVTLADMAKVVADSSAPLSVALDDVVEAFAGDGAISSGDHAGEYVEDVLRREFGGKS